MKDNVTKDEVTTEGTSAAVLGKQEKERLARAALARLMEPQDSVGLALVHAVGAVDALGIATGELAVGPRLEQEISTLLTESGGPRLPGRGSRPASDGGLHVFRTSHRTATWRR
ncbi:hypothetical protein StoSoilB13_11550 [Arthrobacter sp. StoSoilB13]|nr:hypothetical protein StoSoilB13_11550 [Arthrobacter sp. StoSoilB13]